jgi:hypothetical protein
MGFEPIFDRFKDDCLYRSAMFATYRDVLLQLRPILLDKIYNTPSCLLSCGLLGVTSSLRGFAVLLTFDSCDDTLPFHANGQTSIYLLVFSIHYLGL